MNKIKIISCILSLTILASCSKEEQPITKTMLNSLLSEDYRSIMTPLAQSNWEACKEYFDFNNINYYTYEVLSSKYDYYTVLLTDSANINFYSVINIWYNEEDGLIDNISIDYTYNQAFVEDTTEPVVYNFNDTIIFEDRVKNTEINSNTVDIDNILEDLNKDITQTDKRREELDNKEKAYTGVTTTSPPTTETINPSLTFIYE